MTKYIVVRNTTKSGKATKEIVLFFADNEKNIKYYIHRIEKISNYKYVGLLENEKTDLDIITANGPVYDDTFFKRTGIDLRNMTISA